MVAFDGYLKFNGSGGNSAKWGNLIIETRQLYDNPLLSKQYE